MLVLVPPSKAMRADGDGPAWRPRGPLGEQRAAVAAAYEELAEDRSGFGTAVEAKGDLLVDALDQVRGLRTDPTAPAGDRFVGQLHRAAAYPEMSSEERSAYARHVRVVSGLLGVVAPDEPVPRYRLPMGAELPGVGRLATFWRAPLSEELARQADGEVIWDLLSAEYRRALDPTAGLRLVRVRFERPGPRGWRAAPAVVGKQLKGALARHLSHAWAAGDPSGRAAAEAFSDQGYRYHGERPGRVPTVLYRSEA